MPETLPPTNGIIDPTLTVGNQPVKRELGVRFNTFEEAQTAEKKFSDTFIDGAINDNLTVGSESVGIKGYLDNVEATQADNETIANPEAIAGLFLKTTDMFARNLRIKVLRSGDTVRDTERMTEIRTAKERFLQKLHDEAGSAADSLVEWCEETTGYFPVETEKALEFRGLEIDGKYPLDSSYTDRDDFRPTIKIQRQIGATFIMAYTDNRVMEKLHGQDQVLDKRIYLNPEAFATPDIFEQILTTANQAGLSIQLKMFQRAPEFAAAHRKRAKGIANDGFRGDGIVVYADEKHANEVLSMVLAIAKDKPEAFIGRKTSRIPQNVAEGVALGDEPTQATGMSLTGHRFEILNYAARYVEKSGKKGEEARDLFRNRVVAAAKANKVNPRNLAFNAAA